MSNSSKNLIENSNKSFYEKLIERANQEQGFHVIELPKSVKKSSKSAGGNARVKSRSDYYVSAVVNRIKSGKESLSARLFGDFGYGENYLVKPVLIKNEDENVKSILIEKVEEDKVESLNEDEKQYLFKSSAKSCKSHFIVISKIMKSLFEIENKDDWKIDFEDVSVGNLVYLIPSEKKSSNEIKDESQDEDQSENE